MRKYNGFTLIELLVVVLIIGILAAIALPQYQKAVLKSRYASLIPLAKTLRDGEEVYYLTNSRYTSNIGNLDVKADNTETITATVNGDGEYAYTLTTRPDIKNNYIMYQKHSVNFPGEIHCEALTGDEQAEWLCETGMHAIQNLGENITPGYTTYVLEGSGLGMPYWAKDIDCDKATSLGLSCGAVNDVYGVGKRMCSVFLTSKICRTIYEDDQGVRRSITCRADNENICTSGFSMVTYDANGNRISQRGCQTIATDGSCANYTPITGSGYDFTYDANGNMISKRFCQTAAADGSCTKYSSSDAYNYRYDANGNMISQRSCKKVDTNGNCTSYTSANNYDYVYDTNGNMVSQRNCSTVSTGGSCTQYSTANAYDYTYDANGNMTSQRACSAFGTDGKCSEFKANQNYDYTYDANGNRISQRGCQTIATDGSCSAYKTFGNLNYTYDANGNMISQRSCSAVGAGGICTAYNNDDAYDYTYDADGNNTSERHCQTVASDGKCGSYYGTTHVYTYDDNDKLIATHGCANINATTGECVSGSYSTSISSN